MKRACILLLAISQAVCTSSALCIKTYITRQVTTTHRFVISWDGEVIGSETEQKIKHDRKTKWTTECAPNPPAENQQGPEKKKGPML